MVEKPQPVEVEMVESSYQPTKAQLEGDACVDVGFDEAVEALAQDVTIRSIPNSRKSQNHSS